MSGKRRRRYYRREYSKAARGDMPVNPDVLLKMGGAAVALVIIVISAIRGFARRMFKHLAPSRSLKPSPLPLSPLRPEGPDLPRTEKCERVRDGSPRSFETGSPMPYKPASSLLSKGERAFWYPLYRAVK